MKILAVDTATKTCSVALIREKSVIAEYTVNHGDTHSRFIMGMIRDVLAVSRLKIQDLDGFAVTTGPGSFTGLRIGLSTVKGLAFAAGLPIVGVSTLTALASPFAGADKLICPMLDARRKEVYAANYRFVDGQLKNEQGLQVCGADKAVESIREPCIFVGDGAVVYQDLICRMLGPLAIFADASQHIIRAAAVGHIAMPRFLSHHTDDAACIEPVYVRKSDAEKNLVNNVPDLW